MPATVQRWAGVGRAGRGTSGRRPRAPAMSSAPSRRRPHSPRAAPAFAATSPKRSRAAPGSEAPGGGPSPPRARGPGEPWLCSLVLVSLLKAARRPGRSRPEPPRTVIYEAQGAGRRERSARGGGRRTPTPWLSPALPSGRLQPHEDPRPGRRAWRSPDRPLPRPWSLDRSVPWPGRAELKVGGGALARPLGSPRGRSPGHLRRGHPIARA